MSCMKRAKTAIAIFKAILSRVLFALHGFICIWRVTVVKGQPVYWCLTGTFPVMVIETIFTIRKKRGGEWKWLCPSVLLYLGTAVPAIWFLELDLMARRMTLPSQGSRNTTNEDSLHVLTDQLKISISLGREEWCKILEQMLLLILIVGRWLLPKGEITREQLSQLLLVYIGMAADIIELFEAFKEEGVRENYLLTLIILSLWTASLTQFTFVVTATKAKRMRPVLFRDGSRSAINIGGKSCCPTEVLSILISVMLQDGPFLVLRMLLIFRYDVLSYTNLFFTSKNTLVLVLQFYRLCVLFTQKSDDHAATPTTIIISKDDNGAIIDKDLVFGSGMDVRSLRSREGERRGAGGVSDPVTPTDFYYRDDYGGETSEYDDDIINATEYSDGQQEGQMHVPQKKTPTSVRRQSFKRQQAATAVDSPHTSTERECDSLDNGLCHTGTPTSMSSLPHSVSDADSHSVNKGKAKGGRRKISSDSTRGSMSDSREDVRRAGGKPKGIKRQRSAKEHWRDVQTFARAIAFVNEGGKHKTIVLQPVETVDNQTVYFLQSDSMMGKKI